jgi:hypothetical protein
MFKAYADDSASNDPRVYVLAGYLSTPTKWIEFGSRWQGILDMSPKIPAFKMNEMSNYSEDTQRIRELR